MVQREVRARIDRELLADGAVAEPDGTILRDGEGVALRRNANAANREVYERFAKRLG